MDAKKAIANSYRRLLEECTKTDVALIGGKTSEDILGEASLTIIRRWNGDVDEEEVYQDFRRVFLEKVFFSFKKKKQPAETIVTFVSEYPNNI